MVIQPQVDGGCCGRYAIVYTQTSASPDFRRRICERYQGFAEVAEVWLRTSAKCIYRDFRKLLKSLGAEVLRKSCGTPPLYPPSAGARDTRPALPEVPQPRGVSTSPELAHSARGVGA